jgi:hypothetical protein
VTSALNLFNVIPIAGLVVFIVYWAQPTKAPSTTAATA